MASTVPTEPSPPPATQCPVLSNSREQPSPPQSSTSSASASQRDVKQYVDDALGHLRLELSAKIETHYHDLNAKLDDIIVKLGARKDVSQ
ncbi:hypothetical protein H4R34_002126 [Dimargaris verticillata]|uniref:Uncharacterized protein n=1 Tax=Dimargaris verticillata TaxID=2761393 RepID=A0A9W8B4C0_9FUNG|nr:hypothetical protein H4R34_002126 [Dimargaris verticillata]